MRRSIALFLAQVRNFLPIRVILLVVRFIFHTGTVLVTHIGMYIFIIWLLSDQFTHFTFRRSYFSEPSTLQSQIIFWTIASYFIFGAGIVARRISKHLRALLAIAIFAILGLVCFFVFKNNLDTNSLAGMLAVILTFEGMTALTIAAICTIVFYLASKNPPPFWPSIKDIKTRWKSTRSFLRTKNAVAIGILLLIIVQSLGIIILWVRLSLVENKLGGLRSLVCNDQAQLAAVKRATVRIFGGTGEGTGMIIRKDGIVLTNAHVVDQEQSPKVIFPDYSLHISEVMYFNTDADIALLRMEKGDYPTVDLNQKPEMKQLERLLSIGYPLGTGLRGDATVTEGRFISRRTMSGKPVEYIQYDGTINPGNSGGPVITICGDIVGMSTLGVPGMGLAIASDSILENIAWAFDPEAKFTPVEFIQLEPDKSPLDAVKAFYMYIKMRKLENAYKLLTKKRVNNTPLEHFVKGYAQTLDVSLLVIHEVPDKKNRIYEKIQSLDLVGEDVKARYFEGETQVVKEDGIWKLDDADIKEIKEPPWDWFWSK